MSHVGRGRTVSPQERVSAVRARVARSRALLARDVSLWQSSWAKITRSRGLLASATVARVVPPRGAEAEVVENARARELAAVVAGREARCSYGGCGAAPRFRAHVVAAIGEKELAVEAIAIRVCAVHRADLAVTLRDPRVLRVFREKLEARKGVGVPIRSLRAVFREERRPTEA